MRLPRRQHDGTHLSPAPSHSVRGVMDTPSPGPAHSCLCPTSGPELGSLVQVYCSITAQPRDLQPKPLSEGCVTG